MAKGLPYFKFGCIEWLAGSISRLPFEAQGLFISICALYWKNGGELTEDEVNFYFNKPTAFKSLTGRLISITGGKITIKFLDEQLLNRGYISDINSENGKKGGRPKTAKIQVTKPTAKRKQSESKAKKSQEEEEVEEELEKEEEVLRVALKKFTEHRKKKKDPMSVLAIQILKKKLTEFAGEDVNEKVKLLEHAITSGWKTVYEFKQQPNGKHSPTEQPRTSGNIELA